MADIHLLLFLLPLALMLSIIVLSRIIKNKQSLKKLLSIWVQLALLAIVFRMGQSPPDAPFFTVSVMVMVIIASLVNIFLISPFALAGVLIFFVYSPAWAAGEVAHLKVLPSDQPAITRTCPHDLCARTGLISEGAYELGEGPFVDDEGREWWTIRISPFSAHEVFIEIDYDRMSVVFQKKPVLYKGIRGH